MGETAGAIVKATATGRTITRRYHSSASTAASAAPETRRSRQLQAAVRSRFRVVGGSCIAQSTVVRA
jgi:hypothetical protein